MRQAKSGETEAGPLMSAASAIAGLPARGSVAINASTKPA
jgi:hypothetical protein